jgi:hypothetical protein
MALLASPGTITTAGDCCCCNLQSVLKIVLQNANLRFRLEKFLQNPRGSLFHKCGDVRIAKGARDEIKLQRAPADPQETRRIRTHLLVFERSHKRGSARRAEFGLLTVF